MAGIAFPGIPHGLVAYPSPDCPHSHDLAFFWYGRALIIADFLLENFCQAFYSDVIIQLLLDVLDADTAEFVVLLPPGVPDWFPPVLLLDDFFPDAVDYGFYNSVKQLILLIFCNLPQDI